MENEEHDPKVIPIKQHGSAVTENAPQEEQALRGLESIEAVVCEYTKREAFKKHINPDHISLHLVRNLDGIMKVEGGPTVKIFLKWPDAYGELNTILGDAFSLIKRYPVRRTMEVVPYMYTRTASAEIKKKWKKESFTDESEIIFDLLRRGRLKVTETVTTKLTDTVTGESVSVTSEGKSNRFEGDAINLWFRLSRIVRDKYSPTQDDNETTEDQAVDHG